MPVLIIYLLKVNIALMLFYLAYRFALRRLTFYTLNRFFLVSGIIFSSAYPFIDLSDIFRNHTAINDKLIVIVPDWSSVEQAVLPTVSFNYWQQIIAVFWTGVFMMVARLCIRLISLYHIHRSSTPEVFDHYVFRQTDRNINPFSFWQNIYINPAQHEKNELETILQHEKIHVEEWHTLDILLAELSVVFYWFNPGVWLMKQAIKENLEFMTDLKVLNSGVDSKAYQYSLARMIFHPHNHSFTTNFNFISVKKRIMMMNKEKSSKIQVSRYLLMLPVVIVLTLVFTVSKAQLEKSHLKTFTQNSLSAIKDVFSSVNSLPLVVVETAKSIRDETQPLINDIYSDPEAVKAYILDPPKDTTYKKLPNVQEKSMRAPAATKIDGKRSEWDNKIQAFNRATSISYTISNDDDKLYLLVQAADLDIANKIINAGLTFTINGTGKGHDEGGMAITFPYLYKQDHRPGATLFDYHQEVNVWNQQLSAKIKDIRVAGIQGIKDTISIYNQEGIKAAALFGEDELFTYEVAFPLKYLELSVKDAHSFVYSIKLNGSANYPLSAGAGVSILNGDGSVTSLPLPPRDVFVTFVNQNEALLHLRSFLKAGIRGQMDKWNLMTLFGPTAELVKSLISPTSFSGEYRLAK